MTLPREIDLNLMRVFRAIYEEGSLTTVADKLGLTQPAISYSLGRLRELLGDPLFVRQRHRMEPTPAARRLFEPISISLDMMHNAVHSHLVFDAAHSRRTFRLSMSDLGEMAFLPPLCEYLGVHAPNVRVEVDPVSMDETVDALRQGELDLAIGHLANLNPLTQHDILFREAYVGMVREEHPFAGRREVTRDDFLSMPHILVGSNSNAHRLFEDLLLAQGVHRKVALRVPHFTVVPDILERSDMVCAIPHRIARQFNRHGGFHIFSLPIDVPPSDVAVHWHRRYEHEASNRWLRELVIRLLKE
ncbi:LysR family transcriptional regulator [Pusillimonas caeni]|uniref:LysR family transcriptional regulator n=1 Tax=Pusillimonas caeni TaxID=1348472 RepID=UPI000E59F1B8|nr:LysR family transcriptional regulator [Pusillimonas caeni]TFL14675.1 LysR family transcriptional regulator [Pusillimonas caeni]